MEKFYDYIIVGAGLYGAMFAHKATQEGKRCLVIDKNDYVGGFCHTENVEGIEVHKYGAHIFRTDKKEVWDFVNSICAFEPFINSPKAKVGDKLYSLPFNMNTMNELSGVIYPDEAKHYIHTQCEEVDRPESVEDLALSTVGREIYEKFIKGYTEKQWGKKCSELPSSILARIPIRYTYDNNYFNERYQGIPREGYTKFIEKLLEGSHILLGEDFFECPDYYKSIADKVIYTGKIDEFYDYQYGKLDYRSVRFEQVKVNVENSQGVAVVNICDAQYPYTRVIEHKHFDRNNSTPHTILSYEYPVVPDDKHAPSYPIRNTENLETYSRYRELAKNEPDVIFKGRLAEYRYYNMNDIIEQFI